MKFCEKCGSRLKYRHVQIEGTTVPALACTRCEFYVPIRGAVSKPEDSGRATSIKVVGDEEQDIRTMPTTTAECPKCGNTEAYWWLLQTRGGDEPTTQFYRCTKCSYTWRVYA